MTKILKKILVKLVHSNKYSFEKKYIKYFNNFKYIQNPRYTFLTCSDSRISNIDLLPENDAFIIRNIGNQILTNTGSVQYGISMLKTPVLFVLGHSDCGAIKSKLQDNSNAIHDINQELKKMRFMNFCI